jgi:hypothetical protein
MGRQAVRAAAILALMLVPAKADAGVSVSFVAPERYRDAEIGGSGSRATTLSELRQHIQGLGNRYLKSGQDLSIEVLDVDLAGERRPFARSFSDTRIVTGVTPPRIALRYTLRERGRVLRRGEETLSDINFQMRSDARRSGESLAYEKDMLTDWFRATFGAPRRSRT